MGKNNRRSGKKKSDVNASIVKKNTNVDTEMENLNQNKTEELNAQDNVQISVDKTENQGSIGEEATTAKSKNEITFWQKIGLFLAKALFENIKIEINDFNDNIAKLEDKNKYYESQLGEYCKTLENYKNEIDRIKEENKSLNDQLKFLEEQKDKEKNDFLNRIKEQGIEISNLKKSNGSFSVEAIKYENEKKLFNKLKKQFSTLIKKEMTIDEALNIIYQKIEALNNAVGKSESDKNEAIQKERAIKDQEIEEVLKQQNAAEERAKQIEASDKGQLKQQVECLEQQSKRQTVEIELLQADIKKAKDSIVELTKEKENFRIQLENSKEESKTLETHYKKEIDNIEKNNQIVITNLHNDNREKIKKLKDEYETAVCKLKERHKEEEETLKKQNTEERGRLISNFKNEKNDIQKKHNEERDKMQENFEEKVKELTSEIYKRNDTIQSLHEKIASECGLVRRISEEAANNLFETLKSNDIMIACSDDYIDKVEDKNQELLVGAKKLKVKICDLPSTVTPSEWMEQLSMVICELLEDNSSIICKLLKYYAMSNVPCMIDNKREEGICFIRKNISKAYSLLTLLLSQCDITPIIPAIFVENIHESEYEVEGGFNDIESFCPGSINEHIEHVERDNEGKNGIIVGVTKVGYVSADGKVVKTQVLIN